MILDRKKQIGGQTKASSRMYSSPTPSESSISVGEDNTCGNELPKIEECSVYSQPHVQSNKTLFDLLLEENELSTIHTH